MIGINWILSVVSLKMAPKLDPWIRVFDVSNPVKHEKGYTLYKVTSKVFPRNSPEAVTEVIVWKRYSEFKKLHKMLQTLHIKLYLKGTFPSFAKSRLFGRFDDEVVEERRQSALQLLEFAAQHPPLFTSQIFVKFIGESQDMPDKRKAGSSSEQTKIPQLLTDNDGTESKSLNNHTVNAQWNSSERSLCALGGIWKHPQSQDSISMSSSSEELSESDADSLLNTLVSSSDLSMFDPFSKVEEKSTASSPSNTSNSWLLSTLVTSVDGSTSSKDKNNLITHSLSENISNQNMGDQSVSALDIYCDKIKSVNSVGEDISSLELSNSLKCRKIKPDKLTNTNALSNQSLSHHSNSHLSMEEEMEDHEMNLYCSKTFKKGRNENLSSALPTIIPSVNFPSNNDRSGEYLCEAATNISLAQENEANGIFDLAFTHYKAGVATLLKGVQNDNNNARREAVRTKTAQYLMKAEEIYKKHLSGIVQDENRWGMNSRLSPSHENSFSLGVLQVHANELKKYRVLGVIDNVQLVLDSTTNKTYIMKVLHKSPTSDTTVPTICPYKIPFMVQLHKFIETEYAIYLILQHAVGGKLFNYIKSFLQNSPQSPCYESQLCEPRVLHIDQTPTSEGNIYSGKNMFQHSEIANVTDDTANCKEKIPVENLTDSKDLDLIAESECSSSYMQLFTTYAASLQPDKYVGLAKCNIQYQEITQDDLKNILDMNIDIEYLTTSSSVKNCQSLSNEEKTVSSETLDPDKELCETIEDNSFTENLHKENVLINSSFFDLNNISNVENLEHLDAQELIDYSQKLLCNVDKTLRESYDTKNTHSEHCTEERVSNHDEKLKDPEIQNVKSPNMNVKNTQNLMISRRSRQDSCESNPQDKNKNQRKYSDESIFASPVHEGRLSSSAGSLSSKPRIRHFSMVFQQLDQNVEVNYLPESCVRVWAAEMVVAISHLHFSGIICRDLRPDNILLGERGHILLTYFSQWNYIEKPFNLEASENLYSAPEVNGFSPVTPACDWWSLGALLFELLTSKSLASCHPGGISSHTTLNIPGAVSLEGQLLLKQLLTYNVKERLGSPPNGEESVKRHPFFNGIDWKRHAT